MGQARRYGRTLWLGAMLLLAFAPSAHAQRMLNRTVTNVEPSLPINVTADHIATWQQDGHQILLLRGNAIISQGDTTIRTPSSVIWVDLARYEKERVFHLVVYGENGVSVAEHGVMEAEVAYLRLMTTSNKIDIKPFKSKLVQEEYSNDAAYQRAIANRPADVVVPMPNAVQRIPAAVEKDEGIRQVVALQPPPKKLEPGTTAYFQVPPEPKVEPVPNAPNQPNQPIFTPTPPAPVAAPRPAPKLSIQPRTGASLNIQMKPVANGMTAVIVTGGVTLLITTPSNADPAKPTTLDIEADRVVLWTRGNAQQLFANPNAQQDVSSGAHEIYMAGNVEIRTRTAKETETLRADEVYYDVARHVAVARQANLEIATPKLPFPIVMTATEIRKENEKLYTATQSSVFASILPSDPGLKVDVGDVAVEERPVSRSWLFGWFTAYDKDGKPKVENERYFTGKNMVARLEGVPVFYFPYLTGRVEDPLGPLENVTLGYNRIFGFQIHTTWDVFDLFNAPRPEGHRWRLFADYLSERGPFFGTEYDFAGRELFGTQARYAGLVKLYGGWDSGDDVLGGDRGRFVRWPDDKTIIPITHPDFRGWAHARANVQELPHGFSVLGQLNFIRDRNFIEQYFLQTHLNDINQDTWLRVKQQQDNWAWTLLGQVGTREWMTETDWLPKADGWLLGQTFFDDLLVYNAHPNVGWGRLRPTERAPFAYLPNDVRRDAIRADLWQDLSLPFYLGPVKLAPYLVADTAYYSEDVNGNDRGRLYAGGGLRFNMPLSRYFPDIQSDLFNVNGIYHKINLVGNYHIAQSNTSASNFPLFDRLNDDVTDQALRNIRPWQTAFNPGNAAYLTSSPIFNPQNYMIRRLIDSNVDTFDDIHVLQLGIRQRWQTRRGFPGNEHVIDWMSLNLGVSVFPTRDRDNFGHTFGILEYDWTWNIGDRTALVSSGWFEPWNDGPRAFDFGAFYQRPDTTTFYLGYRQIDPLESKAVVASVTYPLSGKYALTGSTVWDFGVDVRSYSLLLSRMGTDLMVNFGLNYNSTLNTFGVIFEVLPNLARRSNRTAGLFPMPGMNVDPMVNR